MSRSPLGTRRAELALVQFGQRRQPEPEEAGRDLGVEDPGRHCAGRDLQHLEVLGGGVDDDRGRAPEQLGQRPDVDGERVEQGHLDGAVVRPGELHQRQLGVVRALPVELGVERVDRHAREALQQIVEGTTVGDQPLVGFGVDGWLAAGAGPTREGTATSGQGAPYRPWRTGRPRSAQASVPPATFATR